MISRFIRILIVFSLVSLFPSFLLAQHAITQQLPGLPMRTIERRTWHIAGKVTDLRGEPLMGASVRVDIGLGMQYFKNFTTDAQGKFRTQYELDGQLVTQLGVKLLVEREGYFPAHEFVNFSDNNKTWEIIVALRPDIEGADELRPEVLVEALAPRLRAELESDTGLRPVRKDLQRAIEQFLDDQDPSRSIPVFDKVVSRAPDCANCRTLMGLALLEAGSWAGASRQFAEAANLVSERGTAAQQVDSSLLLAELENCKGDYPAAAGFLMKAKDLDPKNPLVLQELGRTSIFQQNWQAADEYLKQAIAAGARREARLLSARAFLEEGEPEAAEAEMKEYLAGENITAAPFSVRKLYTEIERRMNMRTYGVVESVVVEPLPSLVKAFPELHGLEPVSSPSDLGAILRKTGESVETFFRNFPNTVSIEQVREERLDRGGKIKDALDQRFQYLLLARSEKSGLGLDEFRTDDRGGHTALQGLDSGFMLTSGFASTSLLFHPAYQSGASFRYLGRQQVEGHTCHLVAFAQNPVKAQMFESFVVDDKDTVVVLVQGIAWIDAENYRIVRLRTDLLTPQPRIRLQRQTTEITYAPIEFKRMPAAMWLPSEVAVTLQWRGKTYRNFHRYSDFKAFNTETKEKIRPAEQPSTAPPGE